MQFNREKLVLILECGRKDESVSRRTLPLLGIDPILLGVSRPIVTDGIFAVDLNFAF